MNNNENLFSEFPPIETKQWEEKIITDLKGADYEKKLVWKTIESINIKPYYRAEDLKNIDYLDTFPGDFPYLRGNKTSSNNWHIRQDIIVDNIEEANKKALDILMKGVTSLAFVFIKEINKSEIKNLFKNISLVDIEINLVCGKLSPKILSLFINEVNEQKIDKNKIEGSIDYDPLGNITITGTCYNLDICEGMNKAQSIFDFAKNNIPKFKLINISGNNFNNAGASITQEIAFSLSMANEYLAQANENGFDVEEIITRIKFSLGIGSNYFMEIAKLRAIRLLWSTIVEQYKPNDKSISKLDIHAITSQWNKTAYAPYVNMLRTTSEAMSAIIGGISSLTILPFDYVYAKPNEFSERIARNQQLILKEEAYLNKIVDPSAGSYYIDNLTNSLAEKAWELFKTIENKGGYMQAFELGFIQKQIKETATKRNLNIAKRKEILLGTNQYPNSDETINENVELDVNNKINTKLDKSNLIAEPIKLYRASEEFEKLRLSTEKLSKTPKVFMFTYGNLAMRKARATFASNFFACAGYKIINNQGFETIEKGIECFKNNKSDIVVICSSDSEYENIAEKIFTQLSSEAIIVVAGYPKKIIESLKQTGIKHFIHIKSNVLETLKELQGLRPVLA